MPLTLVRSRAIGLMTMVDSGKKDHKILAVAMDDPEFNSFREASELPEHRLTMLRRFFLDYKTLEARSVEVDEFQPAALPSPIIEARSTATANIAATDFINKWGRHSCLPANHGRRECLSMKQADNSFYGASNDFIPLAIAAAS